MVEVNVANERIKRTYFHYLEEGEGLAEKTIEHTRRAIVEYERFSGRKDFAKFSSRDAVAFKKSLLDGAGKRAAEIGSRATIHSKLMRVEKFFRWLPYQQGYKRLSVADAQYFSLSFRDRQLALVRPERHGPSLEQVQKVIRRMPSRGAIELRNRAVLACLLLTGSRVTALIDLRLKHVRPDRLGINFDARDVRTKRSKTFTTYFFRFGDDIRDMFLSYVDYLRGELSFRPDDPLFPKTRQVATRDHGFEICGLDREHWKTPESVREILRRACAAVEVPYFAPHLVRNTVAVEGARRCANGEQFKAWSQNMAHDETTTTWRSYCALPDNRQAELIGQLSGNAPELTPESERLVEELMKRIAAGGR
jgi:site-specific recombinase XerD